METTQNDDRNRLDGWLSLLGGPGYQGREARDLAVAEMRAAGADRLFPHLVLMLEDPDPDARLTACEAILWVDAPRAVALVLPLLEDPDVTVRLQACGCLRDFGDERAVASLIRVLQGDPDAQVRGMAAHALGVLGNPAAIPALLASMETDHELDMHGHSAGFCSAGALDDILGTNETRIKVSQTLCKMREGEPDLDRLRRLANERYQQWSDGRDQ